MKILLIYATYSGSTQTAAGIINDVLKTNHEVTMKQAHEVTNDDFTNFAGFVLASPTWDYGGKEGQPHEDFVKFMEKFGGVKLTDKPFAILGLGDSSYQHFCAVVDALETFVKNSGGKLIVPSLRIDAFYQKGENPDLVKQWATSLGQAYSSSSPT